jgi:hypothetical protein
MHWNDSDRARFESKVDRTGACHVWTAATTTSGGYGEFHMRGAPVRAHRFAYMLAHGPIPDGLHVLHRCDNPPCVNVEHLWLGTQSDNAADAVRKGRHAHQRHPESYRGDRNWKRRLPEKNPRGERSGTAKLTEATVREIRTAYAAGSASMEKLRAQYGVSKSLIHKIVHHHIWTHVP